jgi:CubicO group peptidase (beta-lactamase class C family)
VSFEKTAFLDAGTAIRAVAQQSPFTFHFSLSTLSPMATTAEQSSRFAYSLNAALDRELNAVIDTALALNRIVGTVTIIAHRGKLVYKRSAGFADREVRRVMQPSSIFRFASLTKTIVSVAALGAGGTAETRTRGSRQ